MTSSGKNSNEQEASPENGNENDSGDETDEEVLEESPCGRWQKRREQVCNVSNIFFDFFYGFLSW